VSQARSAYAPPFEAEELRMDIKPQAVAMPKSTEHLEKGKYPRTRFSEHL
jgi:hypothetical protein